MVLREGFNCGWVEAELVKIASDHVNPAGAWGSSGSLPAERVRVEVRNSPRRMVRWQATHMSIPTDPVSSEISDLLLFFSYFASQNKEIKSGNYLFHVRCVN